MPHRKEFLEEQLALKASLVRSAAMMENADDATAGDLAELRQVIADVDARIERLRAGQGPNGEGCSLTAVGSQRSINPNLS